jgi:uncharacterized membrane protein (UPF0127 family)
MQYGALKKETRVLIPKCWVARSYFERFLGLMGKTGIPGDEALLFPRCNSIHTFFMRFPIDVVMVGRDGRVVEVCESMGPWRMQLPRFKAKHVIEMRAGLARELGISAGTQLDCEGVWP